jgi:UDP-N-acetylmuramoylalanine--D-glutamate ligase
MYYEFENITKFLDGKRILIAGFGREGKSTLNFILKYVKNAIVTIGDEKDFNFGDEFAGVQVSKLTGKDFWGNPDDFDIMIKSPGIALKNIPEEWKKTIKISSQTDLLLRFFSKQVIGITGTKGKSTTSTLIHHLLVNNGIPAILAGNMGLPFFDYLFDAENKKIVAELSSHQLEIINNSPAISVLLNIFPEHLDHYNDFNDYAKAKWNIGIYQQAENQFFIPYEWVGKEWQNFQALCKSYLNWFDFKNDKLIVGYNNDFVEEKIDLNKMPLKGRHNLKNCAAALGVAIKSGIDINDAIRSLFTFKPLPHRLEFIAEVNGITYINDSISTIPQSAIAALEAFPQSDTIILGGFNRGIDYTDLCEYLLNSSVGNIILMGDVGKIIGSAIENIKSDKKIFYVDSMSAAVETASQNTAKNKICLLSPAAASYDKYINFEYRGNDFRKCVMDLMQ